MITSLAARCRSKRSFRRTEIAPFLDRVVAAYHHPGRIGFDPLRWPRMYEAPSDREIVAFLAASLAYGNVIQINRSLEDLFKRMGPSPAGFVRDFVPGKSDRAIEGFYHRFNTARDLSALLNVLGQMLRGWGSIEAFWVGAQTDGGPSETIASRAGKFIAAALRLDLAPYFPHGLPAVSSASLAGARPSFLYLLPMAGGPSACKRLHLFLRWMVRPDDGIDLGLWRAERPAALEYPVDTHIHRLATYLGATRRKSADAKTRSEITDFFRHFSPDDPVRYDFSLCRMGILKQCPPKQNLELCGKCELRPVCSRYRALHKGPPIHR